MKKCSGCGRSQPLEYFHRAGKRNGAPRYHSRCKTCLNTSVRASKEIFTDFEGEPDEELPATPSHSDPEILNLLKIAKSAISFDILCDRLDLSPKRTRQLIERAKKAHAPIHFEHDVVSVAPEQLRGVQEITSSYSPGTTVSIGAISDTHIGSKHCLRGSIRETVKWMYDSGVRDILHSGDVLEGCYRHAQYELSHSGFDAQMVDAVKCFPQLEGLRYHFISGNHDFTFEEKIGMRVGIAIENAFRAHGRNDWKCYGDRNAYIKIGGAVVNLWHPRGSGAYARSYKAQKRIEGYTAIKPQILLMGHYHQHCYVYERGIHGIMMPCFQGSGSNFAQSLPGPPSIGGAILHWELSETGRVHSFRPHMKFFYEREEIFEARNDVDAIEIPAVGRDRRYKHAQG